MRNFWEMADAKWRAVKALCVGHDPDPMRMPTEFKERALRGDADALFDFCSVVAVATAKATGFWKPNFAFFESFGGDGINALARLIGFMHGFAPDVPVILDRKAADIGNSNNGTAEMAFEKLKADAVTLNPYLGIGALEPFLQYRYKGCILLCRTSNPEAALLQDKIQTDGRPLYLHVADMICEQQEKTGNVGMVVGANQVEQLTQVRQQVGENMTILVPAIGTQGGKVSEAVPVSYVHRKGRVIYNVSRKIIHASADTNFAEATEMAATEYDNDICKYASLVN